MGRIKKAALAVTVLCALGWIITGSAQGEAAEARFKNLAYVYPRGVPCVARLAVSGADEVEFDVGGWLTQTVPVKEGEARFKVDTILLRPGDYNVQARLKQAGREVGCVRMLLTIAPPRDTERMPVWNWLGIDGCREGDAIEDSRLRKECGYTGGLILWRMDPTERPSSRTNDMRLLDQAARLGFDGGFMLAPYNSKVLQDRQDLRGVFADGSKGKGIYPRAPKALDFARRTADTWVKSLAEFPAFRYLFLNTEIEPPLAIHPEMARLAQKEIGLDLAKLPISSQKTPGLDEGPGTHGKLNINPAEFKNGIIPDDHPHLRYLKWWWEGGQGTAAMNTAMAEAAKKHHPELITLHDPYRLAPVRHSHRGLDMIATWTYGTPDIKHLVYTTYLQAAARPDKLLVNQNITLLVGDNEMMVTRTDVKNDFKYDFHGDRGYFSAGPDYVREATWLVISQRPDVLTYYPGGINDFTNPRNDPNANLPETLGAIAQVTRLLVKPYGPAILDSERWKPRVALLASAVGAWFGGYGGTGAYLPNLGWAGEQTLPYATLLLMNHAPFDVLLDDDLIEGAASRYETLVLPLSCMVTQSMADRLKEFIAAGGRVIVNEPFRLDLPGAIRTRYNFAFEHHTRGNTAAEHLVTAHEHRKRVEKYAADLAKHMEGIGGPVRISGPVQSGMRVLTNTLEAGEVRYHFLINDYRTYGPRFGKHKVRFELGVPQMADVTVMDPKRPVLYDAIRRKEITVEKQDNGAVNFEIGLPAASGKLIAALPEPIDGVRIDLPKEAALGKTVTFQVVVLGKSGRVIRGSLPLRVDIEDAWQRRSEWSRFTTTRRAKDGVCEFTFVPGVNDLPGEWTINVTDLVGDKRATATIMITDPAAD
ncbi:MAG: hypothetical protein Q7J67_03955 [bacterium]|nr:hypothetical protein [bacterium]